MCHVSHVTCHVSRVPCHMSHVACHVSHVMCHVSHFFFIYIYFFCFLTKWWSLSVEGLSSTGLPRLVFWWIGFFCYSSLWQYCWASLRPYPNAPHRSSLLLSVNGSKDDWSVEIHMPHLTKQQFRMVPHKLSKQCQMVPPKLGILFWMVTYKSGKWYCIVYGPAYFVWLNLIQIDWFSYNFPFLPWPWSLTCVGTRKILTNSLKW